MLWFSFAKGFVIWSSQAVMPARCESPKNPRTRSKPESLDRGLVLGIVVDEFPEAGIGKNNFGQDLPTVSLHMNGTAVAFRRVTQSRICVISTFTGLKVAAADRLHPCM
ncbi:hypothetical protein AB0M45_31115 [Nocardia sp. NPDC051787]|uniref:hypothetical protein n=1 Tax=Nocardia sp. NPDC051787 TaxID=3155415 RepID=UPI0034228554